jgi:hypothetical protein
MAKTINYKVTKPEMELLKEKAYKTGFTVSGLLVKIIKSYIKNQMKKEN